MQTVERPAERLRLGDVVTAATIIAGGLSAASYAFALGYIFALEPRFLPAFSFGDLLLLFASSTSTAIFGAIVLIPGIAMLFSGHRFASLVREASAARGDVEVVVSQEPVSPKPQGETMNARDWAAMAVSTSITLALSFIVVQDMFSGEPYTFSPFPEFLVAFGMVAVLITTARSRIVQAIMPLFLAVYLLAAFYVVGDVSGRRDLVGSASSRQMPCAFLDEGRDCFDVLLLGSEAAILRKNGKIALVKRDRVRLVQSRTESGLLTSISPTTSR